MTDKVAESELNKQKMFVKGIEPHTVEIFGESSQRKSLQKSIHLKISSRDPQLKNFLIKERSYALASESKYYEAISLLEDLDNDDEPDIGIELLKAECYIQLGRENKAEEAIKTAKETLMNPPMCDVDDAIELANDFIDNSRHVCSLVLLPIVSNMLGNSSLPPDDIVSGMFRCIGKMDKVVEIMLKQDTLSTTRTDSRNRVIALDFGVEIMGKILEKLRTIQGADPENIALKQAISANIINSHYSTTNQHTKAIKSLETGIEHLKKQFGKRVNELRIYSTMLNNIGTELHNSEKFQKAVEYKTAAFHAKQLALDYTDIEDKPKDIKEVQQSLSISKTQLPFESVSKMHLPFR